MHLVDRRTYRAKRPAKCNGFVNDRTIIRISSPHGFVQYTNASGFRKPPVSREYFEKWASHDVTEQLPAGCYMTWEQYLQNREKESHDVKTVAP